MLVKNLKLLGKRCVELTYGFFITNGILNQPIISNQLG